MTPSAGDKKGTIFDVKRFALHDGPGVRTSVFLKGCPLSCAWCHNPESQSKRPELLVFADRCAGCGACQEACPNKNEWDSSRGAALKCDACGSCQEGCVSNARKRVGEEITVRSLVAKIEREREFFEQSGGGVTFTGGEPLSQGEFLLSCLRAARERGIHTAVDTCGHASKDLALKVADDADLILFDLKLMNDEAHRRYTGVPVKGILENLKAIDGAGAEIWIRLPLVPGINDGDANIDAMGRFVASLENTRKVFILPFHKLGAHKYGRDRRSIPFGGFEPPASQEVQRVARRLAGLGLQVDESG